MNESFQGDFLNNHLLSDLLPSGVKVTKVSNEKKLAQLWAGYGSINEFKAILSNGQSLPLIVKRVNPPSDTTQSISHQRKLKSYEVECNFYKILSPIILEFLSSSNKSKRTKQQQDNQCSFTGDDEEDTVEMYIPSCAISKPISVSSSSTPSSSSFTLLLTDLRKDYNASLDYSLDLTQTQTAIQWLASFHALFWQDEKFLYHHHNNQKQQQEQSLFWTHGGYWHLPTRLDELNDISSSYSFLKECAHAIHERMDDDGIRFKTLCHGDFKMDNLLYTPDGKQCSAVDFQYCGTGYGLKDIVMLFISSVQNNLDEPVVKKQKKGIKHKRKEGCKDDDDDDDTESYETFFLQFYHKCLILNLKYLGKEYDDVTFDVIQSQYELALMDYVRFMAGWGFWGSQSQYAKERVFSLMRNIANDREDVSSTINNASSRKIPFLNHDEWKKCIYKRYPLASEKY